MSSSAGGVLSTEQRHRIEENKRKALALRAAKHSATPNVNVPSSHRPPLSVAPSPRLSSPAKIVPISRIGGSSSSVVRSPVKPAFPQSHANGCVGGTRTTQFYSASKPPHAKQQTYFQLGGERRQIPVTSTNATQPHHDTKTSQSPLKWAAPSMQLSPEKAQRLSGKCVLVSRYRFVVDIGYSTPLIAVFHSMSTKQYDLQAKRWSFELQEYTELIRKIRDIGDKSLQVEPLAKAVLVAFNDHVRDRVAERRIPSADLSRIGNALVTTLMPFQKEGVNFSIWRGGRVLIADDMGLGKTLQAICVATYYRHEWPLLIVAPSSVRFTWREQLLRWLAGSIDPQQINVVASGKQSSTSGLINITSYDLMARSVAELKQKNFRVIIMDESHLLKNSKTARSKAAASLLKTAKRVILLSGTPALSRPSELFVQINAVNHKAFPQFHDFGLRYCNGQQLAWGWDFSGSSNMEELQLVLEECVMIRRMKKDVMSQLPPKTRQMVVLDPGSIKVNNHMKQAHKLVNSSKGNERRGTLLQYFHETGTAKIPAVREYIMDLLESDRKILVFAHHQVVLDALEEAVTSKNHQYIRIDGRNSSEQRNHLCERFQTVDEVRVAVLSISAANAGLHLTAASVVVFAELFWNPGILMQAEDRAHRIGQEDSVNVHYLVAQKTADDYIWPLVQQKLDVLGKVGLSKDNFSNADTKYMQDPKQQGLLKYFEESFIESEALTEEADTSVQESKHLQPAACSHKSGTTSKASILNHFKPEIGQCSKNYTEDDGAEGDWLDDIEGLFDGDVDDDPDAPWPPKRLKT